MRARLLPSQPGLAHFFHIRPWEYELLTDVELNGFLDALAQISRAAR